MARRPWYEEDDPDRLVRGAFWSVGKIILAVVVFVALLGGVIWWIGVQTSDVHGAGEAKKKINSADNRISKQEMFEDLYADIKSYDKRLGPAKEMMDKNPNDDFHAANYAGLQQICLDTVEKYNAEARKISAAKWKSEDLPHEIDEKDPKTDCKP